MGSTQPHCRMPLKARLSNSGKNAFINAVEIFIPFAFFLEITIMWLYINLIHSYIMLLVGPRAALNHVTWKGQIRAFDVEHANRWANKGGLWSGVVLSEVSQRGPWWLLLPTVGKTHNGIILSAGVQYWWCSQHDAIRQWRIRQMVPPGWFAEFAGHLAFTLKMLLYGEWQNCISNREQSEKWTKQISLASLTNY